MNLLMDVMTNPHSRVKRSRKQPVTRRQHTLIQRETRRGCIRLQKYFNPEEFRVEIYAPLAEKFEPVYVGFTEVKRAKKQFLDLEKRMDRRPS